eukprot:2309402-Amphidinium_carterae.1
MKQSTDLWGVQEWFCFLWLKAAHDPDVPVSPNGHPIYLQATCEQRRRDIKECPWLYSAVSQVKVF